MWIRRRMNFLCLYFTVKKFKLFVVPIVTELQCSFTVIRLYFTQSLILELRKYLPYEDLFTGLRWLKNWFIFLFSNSRADLVSYEPLLPPSIVQRSWIVLELSWSCSICIRNKDYLSRHSLYCHTYIALQRWFSGGAGYSVASQLTVCVFLSTLECLECWWKNAHIQLTG